MLQRLILAGLLLYCTLSFAQGTVTEVIPLGYRSLAEIAPIVQPLVGPGGSVGGLRDQLVVTTTPARMSEIKEVLKKLDKRPERLVITVRRAGSATAHRRSAAVHGSIGNVEIGRGGVGIDSSGHENDSHVAARATDRQIDDEQGILQRVQVLEGREAYIAAGQDLPLRSRGWGYDTTSYYPATTGFYVVPRLNGDEMFLELSAHSRQAPVVRRQPYGGRRPIDVSNTRTTVAGRLGEWIAIGGTGGSDTATARGIGQLGTREAESDSSIEIRVEKIQEYR